MTITILVGKLHEQLVWVALDMCVYIHVAKFEFAKKKISRHGVNAQNAVRTQQLTR